MRQFKISFSVLTVVIVVVFSKCGNKNTANNIAAVENQIVGKWEITDGKGLGKKENLGYVYEFNKDKTAKINISNYVYHIKYDTLFMDYEGKGEIVLKWIYDIDEDNLILDNATELEQRFWLERKKNVETDFGQTHTRNICSTIHQIENDARTHLSDYNIDLQQLTNIQNMLFFQ